MRICIESQTLNHHQRSGLMTYTEGLVNGLHNADTQNEYDFIYYSLKRKPEEMPGPDGARFHKKVIRIPDRPFFQRRFVLNNLMLPAYFRRDKIDVFHRPAGYTIPPARGVFKVLTVHDLRTLAISDKIWEQNIGKYGRTLSEVDMITVVSECTQKDLMEHFGIGEEKIRVTHLGCRDFFRPLDRAEAEERLARFKMERPFFLSVGSVPRKNLDNIIRAFALCRQKDDHDLVMVCRSDLDKYRALARDEGIEEHVRFITDISNEELRALYNACVCFVFPSLYEGFGLPILEAMQCGTPVITSNVSSCPEVAGEAAVLVDPVDAADIAEAMSQIADDARLRQTMIDKGFERAKMFGWDKFAAAMQEVYAMAYKA